MTALETTTTKKINKLFEEAEALEKKAAFLKNKLIILEAVMLRTDSEDKYLVFARYLKETREELELIVDAWAIKTLELNDLLELAQ